MMEVFPLLRAQRSGRRRKNYARKDARRVGPCGFDDDAVAHDLFDAEGREHAGHYDKDERVGHPAAGADAPPKAESVIHGRRNARVHVGSDKALRLEREGIGEEPVVVQDTPEKGKVRVCWMDGWMDGRRTMRFRERLNSSGGSSHCRRHLPLNGVGSLGCNKDGKSVP